MYRTLFAAAAAVTITALMFVPAMAQSVTVAASAAAPSGNYQARAATVSLAGVDLGSSQGAATALDRIDAAARVVCGERVGVPMSLARARVFAACRTRTTTNAVQTIDAPQLTMLAAAR
jgi:UrcA family protein